MWAGCGARPSRYHTELSHRDYTSFLPVYLPSGFPVKMLMPLTGKDMGALGPQSPRQVTSGANGTQRTKPRGRTDKICVDLLDAGEILSL